MRPDEPVGSGPKPLTPQQRKDFRGVLPWIVGEAEALGGKKVSLAIVQGGPMTYVPCFLGGSVGLSVPMSFRYDPAAHNEAIKIRDSLVRQGYHEFTMATDQTLEGTFR